MRAAAAPRPEVVVGCAEARSSFAVGDRAGEVAAEQRETGAVHRGLGGETAELGVVVHDQVVRRTVGVEPAFDVVEERLDAGRCRR